MKGQKTYALATSINRKLIEGSTKLTKDEKRSFYDQYLKLIKMAAYKGHVEALFDLGQQYEDVGYLGMPNPMYNAKKCVYWYNKACLEGHAEACNNLATFYEKGEGCEKDLNLALTLYKRSSDLGSPNGKSNYKIMTRDLSVGGRYNNPKE
jgi:TPR repeat protein